MSCDRVDGMRRLVLFDIDGTLVLTGGAGIRAMNRAFREMFGIVDGFTGIPVAGRTDRVIIEEALARGGLPPTPEAVGRFRLRYVELLRDHIGHPGPRKGVMPGVILPGKSGRVDYAAHVTCGACLLSNSLGLRYPSDACNRYGLWKPSR